ncbi:putative GTP-binding protein 6 isoform X2 [Prorops nasuta]
MEEAVALVNTLPSWTVKGKKIVSLLTLQSQQLVGSGKLKELKNDIKRCNATAIFVSTNILKHVQIYELHKIFDLPIYDRYNIVLEIFRIHASSAEAKLQVALAENVYIRKKMLETTRSEGGHLTMTEQMKLCIHAREKKLKDKLNKLKEHRNMLRKQRNKNEVPTIAIVGYTNAGKTSLIKALTSDESLKPRNQLFATLDTTTYEGVLPSLLKVLFVDTIGFIQDVPQTLIEPFKVTLEDAMFADIIVHIFDVSHPDMKAQVEHVQETIKSMTNENQPIINVANKCDLAEGVDIPSNAIAVSAIKLTGISRLRVEMEKLLIAVTGRFMRRIKVQAHSPLLSWLYKETTVTKTELDPQNEEYLIVDVIMTQSDLHKLRQVLIK